jgi:hypothetical protein
MGVSTGAGDGTEGGVGGRAYRRVFWTRALRAEAIESGLEAGME